MLGAIAGDIIGSVYEKNPVKDVNVPLFQEDSRFTEHSVLTVGVSEALLNESPFADNVQYYARNYPFAGYGGTFIKWMTEEIEGPYNSWGN